MRGVYGPLFRLFRVRNDDFAAAVDITAGGSLFHVVVDTDETAARVLDAMNHSPNSGRITFMPLNRLHPKAVTYPDDVDVVQMLAQLEYDPRFNMAMQQVFGRTIICKNLEIASKYARSNGLNGITQDGDRVERKGALTGGSHDNASVRIRAARQLVACTTHHTELKRTADASKQQLAQLDKELNDLLGDIQRAEELKRSMRGEYTATALAQLMRSDVENTERLALTVR
jgi:structural maintenance of chromosome 3 (chondroitin sulfate proteoglycan 6)